MSFLRLVVFFVVSVVAVSFDAVAPVELPTELLSDWSPVELEVELLSDWSPVVVDVLLLSDWSPVDVVLSMVRLERPRRSMLGWNVDVEPVTEFCVFDVEPVTDELDDELEPEIDGLTVLVPDALADGETLLLVEPLSLPLAAPDAVEPEVA